MALRFFSDKKRPVHFGSFPLERLARINSEERPNLGDRFGVAIVTTDYAMATDAPLARQPWLRSKGPAWGRGRGFAKSALNLDPFRHRDFADGPHPFETLRRVERPTTHIDEARVPKRADLFARAQFGDMARRSGWRKGRALRAQGGPVGGAAADVGGAGSVAGWHAGGRAETG